MERQEALPAASRALIVTVFVPTSSGMAGTLQKSVPVATPLSPFDVLQETEATPTLSLAVPLHVNELDEVVTVVSAGDTMLKLGGVVSVPGELGGAGRGGADGGGAVGGL